MLYSHFARSLQYHLLLKNMSLSCSTHIVLETNYFYKYFCNGKEEVMVLILHRVSNTLRLWMLQILPVFRRKYMEDIKEEPSN